MENETQQSQTVETTAQPSMTDLPRLKKLGETMTHHGREMALALIFLIVGLLIVRWIDKGLRTGIE
jgi:hypothetical protein